jgi:hypothetical protein
MQYGGEYMKKGRKKYAEGPAHEKREDESVKIAEYGTADTNGFLSKIMDSDRKTSGEME